MTRRYLLLSLLGAGVTLAATAHAATSFENISIGIHPNYGAAYAAVWKTSAPDYTLITDGVFTYLNSPISGQGGICFRNANAGGPFGNNAKCPDGEPSLAVINTSGDLTVANGVFADHMLVTNANNQFSTAIVVQGLGGAMSGTGLNFGVLGGSTSTTGDITSSKNSVGVIGSSASPNGAGVWATGPGVALYASTTSTTKAAVQAVSASASNGLAFFGTGNITVTGNNAVKAQGGSWNGMSDARVKRNIEPYKRGLADLERVRPISYEYNGLGDTIDDGHRYVGVLAQELQKVFPEMVSSRTGKLHPTDAAETDILMVDPSNFMYTLINAVQELHAQVNELQTEVRACRTADR